jgi:aspartate-semialdehyde dehydrogenase
MMTAVVNPTTLLGKELRDRLAGDRRRWGEIRLFTTEEEAAGTLTEAAGEASLIARWEADTLAGADVVFLCGEAGSPGSGLADRLGPVLADLPANAVAVLLATEANFEGGHPVVAGINDGDLPAPEPAPTLLISPHPAVIIIARLLHPLRGLDLRAAVAVVLQPASMRDEAGVEELFEQSRSLLTFATPATGVWERQLAFNLFPARAGEETLAGQLAGVLGGGLRPALEIIQGGIFHGVAASLYVECGGDPGAEKIRDLLADDPYVELAADAEGLGPVTAPDHERVLLGTVRPEPERPGSYWLWAVMDNLTRGGALNALEVAAAALAARRSTPAGGS